MTVSSSVCGARSGRVALSTITVAPAVPAAEPEGQTWSGTTTASADTVAYKVEAREIVAGAEQLAPGPVALQIVLTVGPRRNWLNLWKPTIDALEPLLGGMDISNRDVKVCERTS